MIKAELILDTRTKSKKGHPVKIRVYCDIEKTHKYIALKIYQNELELKLDSDLRKRSSQLDEEVKFCNDNFYKINDALDVIKNGVPISDLELEIELLEKKLEILKKKRANFSGIGFIHFTKQLIEERKIHGRKSMTYYNTYKSVERFIQPNTDILINTITREWLQQFDLFYAKKGLKDSSIKSYIGIIKAIFNEAQSRESLNIKKENPFVKLRAYKNEKKSTELTIDDLIKIKNFSIEGLKEPSSNLSLSEIKYIADLFLFQFAIGGHDLADIATLKWQNIKDNRIVFKRYKNRYKKSEGEEISVLLNNFCFETIEKYGDKSSNRIFTLIPNPENDPIKYQKFNVILNRTIYRLIRKYAKIDNSFTSKSTRYLFRTTAGNLLINDLIIMKLQGHTPQGISFGYQGAINYNVQDKEHQKILNLVFS